MPLVPCCLQNLNQIFFRSLFIFNELFANQLVIVIILGHSKNNTLADCHKYLMLSQLCTLLLLILHAFPKLAHLNPKPRPNIHSTIVTPTEEKWFLNSLTFHQCSIWCSLNFILDYIYLIIFLKSLRKKKTLGFLKTKAFW